MATLQGPVICPTVRAKHVGVYAAPVNGPLARTSMLRSGFSGCVTGFRRNTNAGVCTHPRHTRRVGTIQCTFSSSSNGNGSKAENFSEKDEDYINSSVIEAVEMPSVLLMAAIRNVHIARPTMYHVLKEMVEKMGYAVKVVRVTKRVNEAYFAQIYLTKACTLIAYIIWLKLSLR